jgi:preprotein translocase subunit YajC
MKSSTNEEANMRYMTKLVLSLALTGVVATAGAAFSQDGSGSTPPDEAKPNRERGAFLHGEKTILKGDVVWTIVSDAGVITAADADSITIDRADGTTVTVPLDDDSKIRRNGEQATAQDLVAGDRVRVNQVSSEEGSFTAVLARSEDFEPRKGRKRGHFKGRGFDRPSVDGPALGAPFEVSPSTI